MPAEAARQLRAGMFARVLLVLGVEEAAVVVPEEALLPQGGRQWVVVVESDTTGENPRSTARRVEVSTGVRRGNQVQVLEGLTAGQTIVVAGQQRIQQDGTVVRLLELKPSTPPAQ
jgi:membrane fusion protein (multidrug efflux system)